MNEEWSDDGLGWARFSDDRKMRYRLARFTSTTAKVRWLDTRKLAREQADLKIATFVMLNPSTADAFKLDPTVKRCREFARRWGCDVLEVVNLFALRSPYPADLRIGSRVAPGECGDFSHLWQHSVGADAVNDAEIVAACVGAQFVIAAWGNHGNLNARADAVVELLRRHNVNMWALRVLDSGIPSHPLARGRSFIPYTVAPVAWP